MILINLEDSRERREQMARRLAALGVSYRRVGVDLRHARVDDTKSRIASIAPRLRFDLSRLSAAEIGCWLSHVSAWQLEFADVQRRAATVVEDDVLLDEDFPAAISALEAESAFDIIFLGTSSRNVSMRTPVHVGPLNVCKPVGSIFNTWGYVIGRDYAERLLTRVTSTIRWPIDHVLGGRIRKLGGRVGVVSPALVSEDPELSHASQIQPTTLRLDRWHVLQQARRRLLASRAGNWYCAIYRWL